MKLPGEIYENLHLGNLAGPSTDIYTLLCMSLISLQVDTGETGRGKQRGLFVRLIPLRSRETQTLERIASLNLPPIFLN